MSGFLGALASVYVAPPPSSSATAPSVLQANGASNSDATRTTTTLTGVVAGDLILVWGSGYDGVGTPLVPTVQDSTTGTFANTTVSVNSYTPHLATAHNIGAVGSTYMVCQGWHTLAAGAAATLTIGVPAGSYRGLIAVNMGQVHDAGLWDDGGTRKATTEYSSSLAPIVDNATTTYSHDYVIACITHYESAPNFVADAGWPILFQVGDASTNRMAVVGKAVTAIGDYDPIIGRDGVNTQYSFIGYVVQGVNV
jgi:hypothetical protein